MARYYDVLRDFGEDGITTSPEDAPDSVHVSPFAIMAVWRYRYPVTYSRSKQESFSKSPEDATRLRDPVLIVVEDIRDLTVTHTKANHVSQLNATLLNGTNYITEMFPGDWVGAWIVNSAANAKEVIQRVRDGKTCNRWQDGLKFLGRVTAVRKQIRQDPSGMRLTTYSMNAAGFTEFDASIYYEPYLATQAVGAATDWLRKTGIQLNDLIVKGANDTNTGGITINKVLPMLLHAFYGNGFPKNESISGGADITEGLDNPNAFVIPNEVATIFGTKTGSKPGGKYSWLDICQLLSGIQKYAYDQTSDNATVDTSNDDFSNKKAGAVFTPDGVDTGAAGVRWYKCPDDMLGTFLPSVPQFNGQHSVWALLEQYLNKAVNEMYTCMRVDPGGSVFPTLVVRQLPFSSGVLDETYHPREIKAANSSPSDQNPQVFGSVKAAGTSRHASAAAAIANDPAAENPVNASRQVKLTRFGELPRWIISPLLIKSVDLGRSDALRINFVHVYGETGLQNQNRTGYIIRDPPIADDLDIIRGGLRPYMMTVNCAPADTINRKAGDWMYILSDILMGQHLTLTGTMECVGISSPIAPGDNIEYDDHVLHIESVAHRFSMQITGHKSFTTSLALTHGVKAQQITGDDFSMFSGTDSGDLRTYEAQTSRDYRVNLNEPNSPPSVVATSTDTPTQSGQDSPPPPGFEKPGIDVEGLGTGLQRAIDKKKFGF